MFTNLFGFCCTKRNKDDVSFPFDMTNVLANNPGLSEVFRCLRNVED